MSNKPKSQPRPSQGPQPVPSKPAPRESVRPTAPPVHCQTLSVGQRCSDLIYVFAYGSLFAATTLLILTQCDSIFPSEWAGVKLREPICPNVNAVLGLLGPLPNLATHWVEKVFKGELETIFKLNTVITWPLSLILAFGFLGGYQWVEKLGFLHAGILMYTMAVIDSRVFESHDILKFPFDPATPHEIQVAALVLGFYTIFPMVVINRLSRPNAFSSTKHGCLCSATTCLANLALFAWFLAGVGAVYEYSVKNVSGFEAFPSIADHTAGLREQMGPMKDKAVEQINETAVAVYKFASEMLAKGLAAVEELGEKVLEKVQGKKTA